MCAEASVLSTSGHRFLSPWLTRPLAFMQEAIENMTKLAEFKPMWIEEPTNCDDVIGHVSAPPVPQLPPSVLSTAGSRKTRIQ
jgi:hypothetical protein